MKNRCPDDPWAGVGEVSESWDSHVDCWRDCLRCKNADARLLVDPTKRKTAGRVPAGTALRDLELARYMQAHAASMTQHGQVDFAAQPEPGQCDLLIVLPYPDLNQEAASNVWGNMIVGNGARESTSLMTVQDGLLWACEALGLRLEDVIRKTGVTFALACRPADWTDRSKTIDPSAEMINACKPRMLREIARMRPRYIIALGHASYCAVTTRVTVTKYHSMIGEVVHTAILASSGRARITVQVPVYVGPDPNYVFTHASEESWAEPWNDRPAELPAREPVKNFRWHMRLALTLDVIARAKSPTDVGWGVSSEEATRLLHSTSRILGDFHDRIQEARSADALALRTQNIHWEDQGGHASALYQMIFGRVDDGDAVDLDVLDNEDEEEESDGEDPEEDDTRPADA
jgi:hypothetical protein